MLQCSLKSEGFSSIGFLLLNSRYIRAQYGDADRSASLVDGSARLTTRDQSDEKVVVWGGIGASALLQSLR